MQRTARTTALIFSSIAASVATLGLALLPATSLQGEAKTLHTVELPRVVVSGAREPRVVELPRVVVQGQRSAAPTASVTGLAQPLQPVLARQPS